MVDKRMRLKGVRTLFAKRVLTPLSHRQVGLPPQEPACDLASKVLVGKESQHGAPLRGPRREEPSANVAKVPLLGVDALPDCHGQLFALLKVGLDFLPMAQVVTDDGKDVGQRQRFVLLDDHFGRCAVLEFLDDQLQQDTRVSHA